MYCSFSYVDSWIEQIATGHSWCDGCSNKSRELEERPCSHRYSASSCLEDGVSISENSDIWTMESSRLHETTPSISSSLSSRSPLATGIKLVPSRPSERQNNRSPSPTRKQLAFLEQATPSIKIRQPGKDVRTTHLGAELRSTLGKNFGFDIIPSCLKVCSLSV